MNALQKTLAIIATLALISQTIRHAYVLWVEPRESVLDKYDQPMKGEIESSGSLQELLARYDKVHKEAEEKRQQHLKEKGEVVAYGEQLQTEPFKSEATLHTAISEWEKKSGEIRELRFYWFVGLVLLALGWFAYKKLGRWWGLTLVIAGFGEFIYWTSPTFLGPGTREFDRLLVNKFAYSVISLALLIAVIWTFNIFSQKSERTTL